MLSKEICLDEIFDFPSINSGITEKFIARNKGDIPVYGSKKDGSPIGFIRDDLKNKKYFSNCLTWNRNGSVGYTFYRQTKFMTTDDCRPLVLKEKYKNLLDYNFLRYEVQKVIFASGFAWDNKAGKEKIKLLYITIPIDKYGKYDLNNQKEIARQYAKIENIKKELNIYKERLQKSKINIYDKNIPYQEVELTTLFDLYKGNAKYTTKYILNHKGTFPVFSGATLDNGLIGNINTYDYDFSNEKVLTWTTDGVYAGTVFVRQGKFSLNTHCGLLVLKDSIKKLDIDYLSYILNLILPNYAVGDQNKRVTIAIMKTVLIPIPIDSNNEFDLEVQKQISQKSINLTKIKKHVLDKLKQVLDTQIKIQSS